MVQEWVSFLAKLSACLHRLLFTTWSKRYCGKSRWKVRYNVGLQAVMSQTEFGFQISITKLCSSFPKIFKFLRQIKIILVVSSRSQLSTFSQAYINCLLGVRGLNVFGNFKTFEFWTAVLFAFLSSRQNSQCLMFPTSFSVAVISCDFDWNVLCEMMLLMMMMFVYSERSGDLKSVSSLFSGKHSL